jgi:hypothetical protein
LASVRCATPIAKVNVFLSAFASQRTDVPLCKRRTDFLYGSKSLNVGNTLWHLTAMRYC